MREPTPQTIHLKDYQSPAFLVPEISLDFDVHEEFTRVKAHLVVERNPAAVDASAPLLLNGEALELEGVSIDGRALVAGEFERTDEHLRIAGVPDRFTLETTVKVEPRKNLQLSGLYGAKAGFFTQCEAEGFRRITYFPDRPDVMSRYTVTIHADRETYPVLLSNGNRVDTTEEGDNRHRATWLDPHPKPCYLFAMVAAKLDVLEDTWTTHSGKQARLAIYVDPGKLDQCGFAMQALKRSMKWDEDVFGLELDLENYMIVAVGDFNMGAMENKGLNIFNTKYILARPDTATDMDFMMLDRVVAHEYFHNWTGNRVTCRDWFQLSLKEGLTVFRDQEYGADTYSRPVQRIQEVRGLRGGQFPEDAGPMAHPVRPQSYMEISNFYTATVYEKGAEVVRMIQTLIGAEAFRRGMDLYFQRHDGQAVTCDDFAQAMADASGRDLALFRRWYDQAGTPVLEVSGSYDEPAQRYTLSVRQSCPPTPERSDKLPFHIPFAVGLLAKDGRELPLRLEGEAAGNEAADDARFERVLDVTEAAQQFVFEDIPTRPVPSLLRHFSAPVTLRYDYSEDALAHLMAHDSDPFNRWEAGQRLATRLILRNADALRNGAHPDSLPMPEAFTSAFGRVLAQGHRDPAFAAEALALPSEIFLAEQMDAVDPDALHAARLALRRHIAAHFRLALSVTYDANTTPGAYSPDAVSAGRRSLKNLALAYLTELDDADALRMASRQFDGADNMTDSMAALAALSNCTGEERTRALAAFYERWKDEPLVVDKWLLVQATSRLPGTLEEVRRLAGHPAFDIRNPNKVYALIRGFCANHAHFHATDGSGYAFVADRVIELDALNPQVASRIARAFDRWKRFDAARQAHARSALERIRDTAGLSRDVTEIITRSLA